MTESSNGQLQLFSDLDILIITNAPVLDFKDQSVSLTVGYLHPVGAQPGRGAPRGSGAIPRGSWSCP